MKIRRLIPLFILLFLSSFLLNAGCKKDGTVSLSPGNPADLGSVDVWLTSSDKVRLLQKQTPLQFGKEVGLNPIIDVDTTQTYQTVDGFGYTLTGGSAVLINRLPADQKASLLRELFGKDENSIRVSYLRISIGASDLDSAVFSYDDLAAGQTDPTLAHFSLEPDKKNLIPVLKDIIAINPAIRILGSPWSPPTWMKDNDASKGGSLKPEYYGVYANYFVRYIQAMKAEGITIDAITPQNEPLHPGNNPSLYMTAAQEADFIKNHLGPAFRSAGIQTKIIVYDHNADRPDYPISILNDAAAKVFVDGSAFHLYAGDVSALSQVHTAHPDKNVYFTEQWTGSTGTFSGDLQWHVKNIIIGTMRNWSRTALEWNLANDPDFGPHTPGGCTQCKGAITIGNSIERNVSYYIIAHASKFVPAGSVRIGSTQAGSIQNVAFKTPENKFVLIAVNDGANVASFNIRFAGKVVPATLPGGAAATYVWQ
ncbi:glycoside hydrolase family 30 protein [Flavisolibacter nicotianae]|uniref:glycoside hydrolase family 30 protein n=1 Tax=Flavisolibacter nicotianae TaxID=2364882 RepID=UPI000EB1ED6A|nr:glycoside hydrolase family 30 beta sandwich domain-containing protein [Flavisolibacter nicotianae]